MGKRPVAGLCHFPGNLGVSRLVRIPEIPSADIITVQERPEENDDYDMKPIFFKQVCFHFILSSLILKPVRASAKGGPCPYP
jgi:hypothetical protein